MNSFAKDALASVDQDKWRDELYVLRHSAAARKVFAMAQYYMTLEDRADDEHATELFSLARVLFRTIDEVSREMACRHPVAYHRWNPRRRWVPGVGKFMSLAKELGFETKSDRCGDKTYIKTIDGWWAV